MPYGKFKRNFKKTRRTFKKSRRFAGLAKRIRRTNGFKRRLNNVAEKKMYILTSNSIYTPSYDTAAGLAANTGIISSSFPAAGTGLTNRIGSKIFIRYITYTLSVQNTDAAHDLGMLGLIYLKEKSANACTSIDFNDLIGDPFYLPQLNHGFLKTNFSKMHMKMFRLGPVANLGTGIGAPSCKRFVYKLKIMKEVTQKTDGSLNIPDIWILPVRFSVLWTARTGLGSTYNTRREVTFTDV